MRVISTAMQNYLDSGATELNMFWKITCKNGALYGFTDWNWDVTSQIDGVTYQAATGFARTAMQQKADLSIPNNEVEGPLNTGFVTAQDIRGGRFDFATVECFMAVPTDTNWLTYGIIRMRGGFLGEIRIMEGTWAAEIRGLAYALQQSFIEVYTPLCQADFGDARCKVNVAALTDAGMVTVVNSPNSNFNLTLGSTNAGGQYLNGLITWVTGLNAGFSQEISAWSGGTGTTGTFQLWLPTGYPIQVGDTFTAAAGCLKTVQACVGYNAIGNFRGFPYIPGMNFLFDYGLASP